MSDELPYPPPPTGPPSPDPGPEGNELAPAPPSPPAPAPAPLAPPAPAAPPATAYPAPVQPPPPAYAPAPAYAPVPAYGPPPYGYAPPPVRPRSSGNLWMVITAVVVVAVLLMGVIAYVVAGYAFASGRISDAATAVNAMNAHRGYVNATFDLLATQLTSFETMGNPKVGKSTAAQLTAETQSMTTLVGGDDRALAAARARMNDQQWLTAISGGRLAASTARIDHARKAASNLKSAAGDYVLLGQFFQTYFQALTDWETLLTDDKNKDFVGVSSSDLAMQADAAKALDLSTSAPGLPNQYHDLLIAFQALAADIRTELNARTQSAFDAASKLVTTDITTMNAVDFSGTSAKIKSYFQHYRDDFNAEMDKATI